MVLILIDCTIPNINVKPVKIGNIFDWFCFICSIFMIKTLKDQLRHFRKNIDNVPVFWNPLINTVCCDKIADDLFSFTFLSSSQSKSHIHAVWLFIQSRPIIIVKIIKVISANHQDYSTNFRNQMLPMYLQALFTFYPLKCWP